MEILDLFGRSVQSYSKTDMQVGEHSLSMKATNLAAGIYFCRLETNSGVKVLMIQKMRNGVSRKEEFRVSCLRVNGNGSSVNLKL